MRLFGIDVEVHWSWWSLITFFAVFSFMSSGIAGAVSVVILFATVLVIVLGHEFAHALTARWYGYDTEKIIMHFLGGAAMVNVSGIKPHENFWISFAGPAFNLVLWLVTASFLLLNPFGVAATAVGGVISTFGTFNLIIGVFNLIPAYPMDGGRIIRALMAGAPTELIMSVSHALSGICGLFFLALVPVTGNIFLGIVALIIFFIILQERSKGQLLG
jgi:stage IV sporulation protein FB